MSCKRIVITELRKGGVVTIGEIVDAYGYTKAAVSVVLRDLVRKGAARALDRNYEARTPFVIGDRRVADKEYAGARKYYHRNARPESRDPTFDALLSVWGMPV